MKVALVNSADPRGLKVGGIETYVRDYIEFHPDDMALLFIGPDEVGDLRLDVINSVTIRGRTIGFLPISRVSDSTNSYPGRIGVSETFRFLRLMWRKRALLRLVLAGGGYSVELRRVEYGALFGWLRVPFIQMVHLRGERGKPMSGLQNRHWLMVVVAEYVAAALCDRFYCVNGAVTQQLRARCWPFGRKFATLTTWANTALYRPTPFRRDGVLRLVFAGRADDFKRLDIMLAVVARVRAMSGGAVEFHYAGDGDLTRYAQFAAVADIVVLHGRMDAADVAGLLAQCDIGLLTSEFEGMPRFVIECMASGRPVVALHLPQLEAVTREGVSGHLVARSEDQVTVMAAEVLAFDAAIAKGRLEPLAIADCVRGYTPKVLLEPIFADHRRLADRTR